MKNKPKKSLGQNFLRDEKVVQAIVDVAGLSSESVVIEVGPGEGVLTALLAKVARSVIAIELDDNLVVQLQIRFDKKEHVHIEHADIRRVFVKELLAKYDAQEYVIVANLPYYITSSIVRFFMESQTPPTHLVIMVQKEVAERITAKAGAMSILAIAVQYYGDVQMVMEVPRTAFEPVPKVDSAVIRIDHHGVQTTLEEDKSFFRVVRAGFSARRKMLVNNLSHSLGIEKEVARSIIEQCGFDAKVRPQEIDVEGWKRITKALE